MPAGLLFINHLKRDWPPPTGTRSSSSCELRRWGSGGTGVSAFISTSHLIPSLFLPVLLVGGARVPLALPWSVGDLHVWRTKVGGSGFPGPCPTAMYWCQSWRGRASRPLPYGQWKCRRPSACPACVGDHRSVQGSASLTFCLVSCGVVACRRSLARIFGARQTSLAKWERDSYHALGVWLFPLSIFGEGSFLPADSLTVLEGHRVPLMGGWPGLFDSAGVPATGAGASNAGSLGLFGNRPTLDYLDSGRVADLIRDSIKGILLRGEPAVASSFPRSLVTEEVVAGMLGRGTSSEDDSSREDLSAAFSERRRVWAPAPLVLPRRVRVSALLLIGS